MATSESLSDFESEDTCENGETDCPNAPNEPEVIDGDIDRIPCKECFIGGVSDGV